VKRLAVLVLALVFVFVSATGAFAGTTWEGTDSQGNSYSGVPQQGEYQGSLHYQDPLPDGDLDDNDIGNANMTGLNADIDDGSSVNDMIKSRNMTMNDGTAGRTQRTHGEYQNNSNSCASCHQTHTAAAKDLLFKGGVYSTCAACHDGTLGFYNVFANGADASTAGTFGGTEAGNASVHLATGLVDGIYVGMAPGGNHMVGPTGSMDDEGEAWKQPFDCAACHAPHGSYSDRLLHYNPNEMANTVPSQGGQKQLDVKVIDGMPTLANVNADGYVAAIVYKADLVGMKTVQNWTNGDATVYLPDGEKVIVLLKKGPLDANADYIQDRVSGVAQFTLLRDLTPWLYGYKFDPYPIKKYFTQFKVGPGNATAIEYAYDWQTRTVVSDFEKEYGHAYAKGARVVEAKYADIALCYVVKLAGDVVRKNAAGSMFVENIDFNTVTDFGGIRITRINTDIYDEASKGMDGYGVLIGKYCAACHTDYRALSAGQRKSYTPTGMFSWAFRHTTNNDRYTCLKCHFAHGTDVEVMWDARDYDIRTLVSSGQFANEAEAKAYMVDKNPSSALKRYTNMAVCWKCHTDSKASQLKNNLYFWDNEVAPHGAETGIQTHDQYGW